MASVIVNHNNVNNSNVNSNNVNNNNVHNNNSHPYPAKKPNVSGFTRKRKVLWTGDQKRVLVDEVCEARDLLFSKLTNSYLNEQKQLRWERIAEKISLAGRFAIDAKQARRRWEQLKSNVKIRIEVSPNEIQLLTPLEQKIFSAISGGHHSVGTHEKWGSQSALIPEETLLDTMGAFKTKTEMMDSDDDMIQQVQEGRGSIGFDAMSSLFLMPEDDSSIASTSIMTHNFAHSSTNDQNAQLINQPDNSGNSDVINAVRSPMTHISSTVDHQIDPQLEHQYHHHQPTSPAASTVNPNHHQMATDVDRFEMINTCIAAATAATATDEGVINNCAKTIPTPNDVILTSDLPPIAPNDNNNSSSPSILQGSSTVYCSNPQGLSFEPHSTCLSIITKPPHYHHHSPQPHSSTHLHSTDPHSSTGGCSTNSTAANGFNGNNAKNNNNGPSAVELERLAIERERLSVEQSRLEVERERLTVERHMCMAMNSIASVAQAYFQNNHNKNK